MRAVKYLAYVLFSSLLLIFATLFLTRPAVPSSSPMTYPSSPQTPIPQAENSWELYAQADRLYLNSMEPSDAASEPETDLDRVVVYQDSLDLLRRARLRPEFRCVPDEKFYSIGLLELCSSLAESELEKGKLSTTMDLLAALSRLRMNSSHLLSGSFGLAESDSFLKVLRSGFPNLKADKRERLLAELNRLTDAQSTFAEFIQAQRHEEVRILWLPSTLKSNSRIAQLFNQRLVTARPQATVYLQLKFDRWRYLIEQGEMVSVKGEWEKYWGHVLPISTYENFLFLGHYLIYPARTLANLTNKYTPQPGLVADPLTDLLVAYNESRLLWESMRIELAITIFWERHEKMPARLMELVDDGLLSSLPRDPYHFKGQPSQALLSYDGEKCWSVGWDGIDQKGEVALTSYTSITSQGDLIVWPSPKP